MKVLFLTKYAQQGASSRYRVYQYLPYLRRNGVDCETRHLFSDDYLQSRYGLAGNDKIGQLAFVLRALFSRYEMIMRTDFSRYDLVFVQYEALPYLPAQFEHRLFAKARVVVDYDDAAHITYEQHKNPLLRRMLAPKISSLVRQSKHVIVANSYLASWAQQFNSNVTVIPTSVDIHKYARSRLDTPDSDRFFIGWIGTPITAKYLSQIRVPLEQLSRQHEFEFRVIGASVTMDGVKIVNIPWHEETEVDELIKCSVGVMPLTSDSWSQGKSALKLIQYLAAGIAAVASPVGANRDVIKDGINGLLAATENEWFDRLSALAEDSVLRRRLGQNGRQTVEDSYSIQVNGPRLLDVFKHI